MFTALPEVLFSFPNETHEFNQIQTMQSFDVRAQSLRMHPSNADFGGPCPTVQRRPQSTTFVLQGFPLRQEMIIVYQETRHRPIVSPGTTHHFLAKIHYISLE